MKQENMRQEGDIPYFRSNSRSNRELEKLNPNLLQHKYIIIPGNPAATWNNWYSTFIYVTFSHLDKRRSPETKT